jgi:putative spermidine/putrescine transport system ATP-binding protein
MATIELIDVGVTYPDGTRALDHVSLTVPENKVTAVLGPSGSGKSTALKVIGGLVETSEGRVLIGGQDVTAVPAERRDAGVVFQSYALFPNMTVEENVGFGLRVRGVAPAERRERVSWMLSTMKIERLRDKRIRQISGGEAQRVALARAMVFNPKILLMDEPLSALDAQIRDDLRAELRRFLTEFRTTTVYVTHDQTEALSLGDQVAVMRSGRVMQTGTPAEIYSRPASLFVAAFIGNANLVPCVCDGRGGFTLPFGSLTAVGHPAPAGERIVMFRPEDVCIGHEGSSPHFSIKVEDVVYLGSRIRVRASAATGHRILLDVSASGRFDVGDVLPVRVDLGKIHVLNKEDP